MATAAKATNPAAALKTAAVQLSKELSAANRTAAQQAKQISRLQAQLDKAQGKSATAKAPKAKVEKVAKVTKAKAEKAAKVAPAKGGKVIAKGGTAKATKVTKAIPAKGKAAPAKAKKAKGDDDFML